MKLALNGAITIGTLDGANVEISERVGRDNIAIFGLTTPEVAATRRAGPHAQAAIAASPRLQAVLASLDDGTFSPGEPGRYRPLADALRGADEFLVTADFEAYWAAQRGIDGWRRDETAWWRASILNTARTAWFSSDRTIREYAHEIWRVPVLQD
jgi:starch phosphorylase